MSTTKIASLDQLGMISSVGQVEMVMLDAQGQAGINSRLTGPGSPFLH